ncbi:hypothetical protein EP073_12015 [Geovibrio thiophilus]|uniref:Uncharacterized protein n=1 Tax=Geovibrio thiophilus TaxID=139438 RepID=A0A410K160_9BACT|nr:hypothetical protein [Geovibrio thiophilus]QAR34102.1 hypothetical protein EP073_12015 [Geovibrio thiophilus]
MMQTEDIRFYRSKTVTDTADNGGHMDISREIISGVKFNLFPRVTSFERTNGKTRLRKAYMANRAAGAEPAFDAAVALTVPSTGGDRFYIKAASSHAETEGELTSDGWTGGGRLYADITAGDTSVQVLFEGIDYEVPEGALLMVKADSGAMFSARTAGVQWTGNVAEIELSSQASDNFAASETHAGICVELGNLEAKAENISLTSAAGTFSADGLIISNAGAAEDDWTVIFISPSAFTVSGAFTGSLPAGSTSANYQAMNTAAGDYYFAITYQSWGGSWQAGDRLTFSTRASAKGFWLKEVVPAGTEREADNFIRLDWMTD